MADVGRPTEKTDEVIRKIEEVAALDGSVEEMAYYAGIHRATLYRWLEDDKELSDRIQSLRERPVLKARQTIVKALNNPTHASWYLGRKKKKEFAERIEKTGADGEPLQPDTKAIKDLTKKLNELYRGASSSGNGGTTSALGTQAQD